MHRTEKRKLTSGKGFNITKGAQKHRLRKALNKMGYINEELKVLSS